MRKLDKVLLGAAVAGILGGVVAGPVAAAKSKDVECQGVNACKGKGSCGGAQHSCAGQNACKGQGWVKVSKDVCDQLGGTAQPLPAEKKS